MCDTLPFPPLPPSPFPSLSFPSPFPSLPSPIPSVPPPTISLIALTQFIYQTTFAPMIYWIFLNKFLKASSSASRQYRQPRNSDVASDEEDSTEHYNSGAVLLDKREYNSQSSLLSSTRYKTSRMVHSPTSKSPQPSFAFRSSSSYGSVDDDSTADSAHAIQQI